MFCRRSACASGRVVQGAVRTGTLRTGSSVGSQELAPSTSLWAQGMGARVAGMHGRAVAGLEQSQRTRWQAGRGLKGMVGVCKSPAAWHTVSLGGGFSEVGLGRSVAAIQCTVGGVVERVCMSQETGGQGTNDASAEEREIRDLLQKGDYDAVVSMWTRSKEQGGGALSLFAYNCVLNALGKQGEAAKALLCFQDITAHGLEPSIISYNTLIKICNEAGMSNKVFQVFEEMKANGVTPDVITYNTLINACKRARQLQRAFGLLEEMRMHGVAPDLITYHSLIDVCGWLKDYKKARAVFDIVQESEELEADEVTYTSMINVYGRCGRSEDALKMFRRMKDEAGLQPNAVTYSTVVHALSRSGRMRDAWDVYEDMVSHGHKPKAFVFSTLIHGYGHSGELDKAEAVLRQELPRQGVSADAMVWEAWLQANVASNNAEASMGVFREMRDQGLAPRLFTYNSLLGVLRDGERPVEDVLEVYAAAVRTRGVKPDETTVSLVVDYVQEQNQVEKLWQVVEATLGSGGSGDGSEQLLKSAARGGANAGSQGGARKAGGSGSHANQSGSGPSTGHGVDVFGAVGPFLFTTLLQIGMRTEELSVSRVLQVMREQGLYPQMRTLFSGQSLQVNSKTVALLQEIMELGIFHTPESYQAFVEHCLRHGALDFALKSLSIVRAGGVSVSKATYNRLLRESGKFLPLDDSLKVFEVMGEDGVRDVSGYTTMIEACARRGSVTHAFRTMEEMEAQGIEANTRVYTSVLHLCAANGDVERAYRVLQRMQARKMKGEPTVFTSLINSCGKGMQMEMAFDILDMMQSFGLRPNAITYNSLIDACLVSGDLNRAFETFQRMEREEGVVPDLITYNSLIRGCGKALQLDRAFEIVDSMRAHGVSPDTNTYCSLIDACGQCGKFELAKQYLEEMRSKELKPNLFTYRSFLHACAKNGALSVALDTLDDMRDAGFAPDEVAYQALYHAFLRNGYSDHALSVLDAMERNGFADSGLFPVGSGGGNAGAGAR